MYTRVHKKLFPFFLIFILARVLRLLKMKNIFGYMIFPDEEILGVSIFLPSRKR